MNRFLTLYPYFTPQVELDEDSNIKDIKCTCAVGLSKRCSHAGALYYRAVMTVSSTQQECRWRKDKEPVSTKQINEYYTQRTSQDSCRDPDDADKQFFLENLKTKDWCGMTFMLDEEPLQTRTLTDFISIKELLLDDDYKEKLKITDEQIRLIEESTKQDSKTETWLEARKYRLTSSNFGRIIRAKSVTESLLCQIEGAKSLDGIKAIEWGRSNESLAKKQFFEKTKLEIEESGLFVSNSGVLGASPDGLIGDDALIEVKCPYSDKEKTITDACKGSNFCLKLSDDGTFSLKENHAYYSQVQGQLYLSGRSKCFFMVWTLVDSVIIELKRDEDWKVNLTRLEDFFFDHFRNHLVKKLTSGDATSCVPEEVELVIGQQESTYGTRVSAAPSQPPVVFEVSSWEPSMDSPW